MKYYSFKGVLNTSIFTVILMTLGSPMFAVNGRTEIFKDTLPDGMLWRRSSAHIRNGGNSKNSTQFIYANPSTSPAELTHMSFPIRKDPGPGEYRYITFSWVKWGGEGQIKLKFEAQTTSENEVGKKFNYTYYAGKSDSTTTGIKLADHAPGNWVVITRDLWKDFGDFTLKGVQFICPSERDAGFDAIFLGTKTSVFESAPDITPTQIATSIDVEDKDIDYSQLSKEDQISDKTAGQVGIAGPDGQPMPAESDGVQIDWAAQAKAGGNWMYPLYFLGFLALIIALQRFITSRSGTLAPRRLRKRLPRLIAEKDVNGILKACEKYPSTLSRSLSFIFNHLHADREAIAQTSGDIAVRDVRKHLSKIYPLSIIASLSPLLGLLGTIVGMIEAFGLVALYGDEGGPTILSGSISKALITTALGLIIAAPCVAVYFVIKNRIMRLACVIEVEIENVITELYIKGNANEFIAAKQKQEDKDETTA